MPECNPGCAQEVRFDRIKHTPAPPLVQPPWRFGIPASPNPESNPGCAQEVRFDKIKHTPAPAPAGAVPAAASPAAQLGYFVPSSSWAANSSGGGAHGAGGGFTDSGLLSSGRQEYDCPCAPGACQGPEVLYSFRATQQGFVKVRGWGGLGFRRCPESLRLRAGRVPGLGGAVQLRAMQQGVAKVRAQ